MGLRPTKGDEDAVRKVGLAGESARPTSAPSGAGAFACQPASSTEPVLRDDWMHPGTAIRPRQQPVRFVVRSHALLGRVPFERPPCLHGQIRENAAGSRDVAFLNIRDWFSARIDRSQKILHMMPYGRGHVPLQILLGSIFRILLELVSHVLVYGLAFSIRGRKVIAHNARLQRPFFSIECRAPRVFFVRGGTVTAMLPYHS